MKIVSVNLSSVGSTGKIMQEIHRKASEYGHECLAIVPPTEISFDDWNVHYVGSLKTKRLNAYLGILTGYEGCFSVVSTAEAIKHIIDFKPDVIHLHNLHGSFLNLPLLMNYIKKHHVPVVWTLHDCWAFTGHCPHFDYEKCDKWKNGCYRCPRYRQYPKSLFDNSKFMWKHKKNWFTDVENLTVVTPSQWLADLVSKSYLKEYPLKVIYNGIDLNVFKPTKSDFRKRYNIEDDKKIVLGVAFGWGFKKGLDVFINLSERLGDKYQFVIVGTNDNIDEQLNDRIISIHRTNNQSELAEIYSVASVFVNPTREEVLGLTNIEANACGTPVITFRSGGSPECVDVNSGIVVDCDDIEALYDEIIRICEENPYSEQDCIRCAEKFSVINMLDKYISLFEDKI